MRGEPHQNAIPTRWPPETLWGVHRQELRDVIGQARVMRRSLPALAAHLKPASGIVGPPTVSVIGVPMQFGQKRPGTELGPSLLRKQGAGRGVPRIVRGLRKGMRCPAVCVQGCWLALSPSEVGKWKIWVSDRAGGAQCRAIEGVVSQPFPRCFLQAMCPCSRLLPTIRQHLLVETIRLQVNAPVVGPAGCGVPPRAAKLNVGR